MYTYEYFKEKLLNNKYTRGLEENEIKKDMRDILKNIRLYTVTLLKNIEIIIFQNLTYFNWQTINIFVY